MPLGHGDRGVERAVVRCQVKRRGRHVAFDGFSKIAGGIGHHVPQVAQGENPQRRLLFIDHHDAAHLLLVHQGHRLAQGR
ncbi:hypothetical protein D3C86_1913870 [compost metagenome]